MNNQLRNILEELDDHIIDTNNAGYVLRNIDPKTIKEKIQEAIFELKAITKKNDKFREDFIMTCRKLDRNKIWAGNRWHYNGISPTTQKQMLEQYKKAIKKYDAK